MLNSRLEDGESFSEDSKDFYKVPGYFLPGGTRRRSSLPASVPCLEKLLKKTKLCQQTNRKELLYLKRLMSKATR